MTCFFHLPIILSMDKQLDVAFARSAMLVGAEGIERLRGKRVAVFGIGGVGGHAAESLARAGVGHLTLVDGDVVAPSNLNRQTVALRSTLGAAKTVVMQQRIADIVPQTDVTSHVLFYTADTQEQVDLSTFDHVLDCIDMVSSKLLLAVNCQRLGVPLISAMGAGNKLDPTQLRIDDISRTSVCPLARVMRRELKERGILHLPVAYSTETPLIPSATEEGARRATPGSLPFVPAAMGLAMASHVVRALLT